VASKLCDALVTHGPYQSALEIGQGIIKRYISSPSLLYLKGNSTLKKMLA